MSGNTPVLEACPRCPADFLNCTLLEESEPMLKLRCENCTHEFQVRNTTAQRSKLSNVYGVPSQIDQLKNIDQLCVGSAIGFKRVIAKVVTYEHHAIVTDINKAQGTISVVEFVPSHFPVKGEIVKECKKFESIKENAFVRRYMPLDCSPLSTILERANQFIDDPSLVPNYHVYGFNCQHLTSWCKTGELTSDEAERARMIYTFTINSLYVISLFCNPIVTIGIIAADAYVRLSHRNVNIKLVDEKMASMETVMKDGWLLQLVIFGIIAAVGSVVAAPAMAVAAGAGLVVAGVKAIIPNRR